MGGKERKRWREGGEGGENICRYINGTCIQDLAVHSKFTKWSGKETGVGGVYIRGASEVCGNSMQAPVGHYCAAA